MTTIAELDARLAELEARLAPSPQANPPIVVGELSDVPAPGSPIASVWAQEVSNRIVHRFSTKAALDAWAAASGSVGVVVTATSTDMYVRQNGVWVSGRSSVVGSLVASGTVSVANTYVDLAGVVSWTPVAGHKYHLSVVLGGQGPGSSALVRVAVNVTSGGRVIDNVATLAAGDYTVLAGQAITSPPATPQVATIQAWTSVASFAIYQASLIVEDMGV